MAACMICWRRPQLGRRSEKRFFPSPHLHHKPAWIRRLALAARQRAVTEFDERIVIEKTLAVYGELVPGFQVSADVHRV